MAAAVTLASLACAGAACGGATSSQSAGGTTTAPTVTTAPPAHPRAPIVVTNPTAGDTVGAPISFAGTAEVFEGTVSVELRGADGSLLSSTFVTASCGNGCRGDFHGTIAPPSGFTGAATLRLFERSAEDGSALHVVSVPVTVT
jgi:hypothetical protein